MLIGPIMTAGWYFDDFVGLLGDVRSIFLNLLSSLIFYLIVDFSLLDYSVRVSFFRFSVISLCHTCQGCQWMVLTKNLVFRFCYNRCVHVRIFHLEIDKLCGFYTNRGLAGFRYVEALQILEIKLHSCSSCHDVSF